MFDIVMYGREKHKVVGRIPSLGLVYFSDGEAAPAKAVKPVIRLTPLVRAEMLVQAVKDHIKNVYADTTAIPELLCIRGVLIHEDRYFKARDAARFIQSIGGYEAAQLYTDCDGYVNGRFIRGDDVRRALRILEGL
jgi:hypothetical protein